MKGFIEVHVNRIERLLNIRQIEIVTPDMGGGCHIFFAFNSPDAIDPDNIHPDESYDEVKRMIEEAME